CGPPGTRRCTSLYPPRLFEFVRLELRLDDLLEFGLLDARPIRRRIDLQRRIGDVVYLVVKLPVGEGEELHLEVVQPLSPSPVVDLPGLVLDAGRNRSLDLVPVRRQGPDRETQGQQVGHEHLPQLLLLDALVRRPPPLELLDHDVGVAGYLKALPEDVQKQQVGPRSHIPSAYDDVVPTVRPRSSGITDLEDPAVPLGIHNVTVAGVQDVEAVALREVTEVLTAEESPARRRRSLLVEREPVIG